MSRYEAVPSPLYADYWHVRWPTGGSSEPFTEAEASIIAWALNGIAAGGTLESKRVVGHAGDYGVSPPDAAVYEVQQYDGPTDGVAP